MPHYADGTEARVGDVVRGKGYNVRDEHGELAEVVGILTGVTPGVDVCNVTLLIPDGALGYFTQARVNEYGQDGVIGHVITGRTEFGQADHFERVS